MAPALVAYPDSDSDSNSDEVEVDEQQDNALPLAKRRRLSDKQDEHVPPPLPATFHNLYSSSVRTSTTDDPSLHGGRKRLIPHAEGNWATHLYLEWFPNPRQQGVLNNLVSAVISRGNAEGEQKIYSLLETPLGVPLPLHISLSAPLILRTETKDDYLESVLAALKPLAESYRTGITVSPDKLSWHLNQDGSRRFLVLHVLDRHACSSQDNRVLPEDQVQQGTPLAKASEQGIDQNLCQIKDKNQPHPTTWKEKNSASGGSNGTSSRNKLNHLLKASNRIAKAFKQPQLYIPESLANQRKNNKANDAQRRPRVQRQPQRQRRQWHGDDDIDVDVENMDLSDYFHISIAWALTVAAPGASAQRQKRRDGNTDDGNTHDREAAETTSLENIPEIQKVMEIVKDLTISFDEIKIKIGKDVTSLPFGFSQRPMKR